ncbi:MAG: amino acid adenylation domain-containing protein, partial [Candidatus Aminicenantes bacterium]
NTIPVRICFEEKMKFYRLLQKVQEEALASEPYHYHPLAEIQSGSALKQNLIDHILEFENYPIAEQIEGYGREGNKSNKSELKLTNVEIFEQTNYDFNVTSVGSDRLMIKFQYNGNVYDGDFVERIAKHFSIAFDQVVENQELAVRELTLLSEEDKNRILYEFNDTAVEYPRDKTIHQLFEEQVERTPDRIALVGPKLQNTKYKIQTKYKSQITNNKQSSALWAYFDACGDAGLRAKSQELIAITYKELNEESNRLAGLLIEKGIQSDTIVGIMMERSVEMIIGIMGILKAGGAYLPIGPDYPEERIDYMLKDSQAKLLVTTGNLAKEGEKVRRWEGEIYYIEELMCLSYPLTFLPSNLLNPSDLAYLIYTSGSTGKPKGAMVEHIGMINHISAKVNDLQISRNSVVAQNASHTFDISVWQFFSALTQGGKTVIYPDELVFNPDRFISRLIHDQITILEVVPSYLAVILNSIREKNFTLFHLEYLLVTGEEVKPHMVKQWFEMYPNIKMINAYGPTEASDDITHHIVDKAPDIDRIPIGKPLQNMKIYIVDNYMQLCPIGVKGEIWVAGIGVGRGYLNDALKTNQVFMRAPFTKGECVRLYKTGDLGRWLPDGTIEFFGRTDYQVKIHGFRIELGEIENRLLNHPGIKEVVVIDRTEENRDTYLCAYIVSDREYGILELREYLAKEMSDYMIPSYFLQVEKIPLTPNGKIDRRALPKPEVKVGESYSAPGNETEKKLVEIWSEVLGRDELHASQLQTSIGISDNFFELGGHSLKAMVLVSKIHKVFNVKIPLSEIFKNPEIRELAGYIKDAVRWKYEQIELVEEKEYYVVSSAQKRLYFLQQMYKSGTAYNITTVMILEGIVSKDKFEQSIRGLIRRHESFRTSIELVNEEPVQRIHEHVEFGIEYYDFSPDYTAYTDEKKGTMKVFTGVQGAVFSKSAPWSPKAFDLSKAPLLRVGLIRIDSERHILAVDMHHIITDGISAGILYSEFTSLFLGEELPALSIRYRDYSEWHNNWLDSVEFKKQEEYWLKRFVGEIPVLNMPSDYTRPKVRTFEGDRMAFVIKGDLINRLRRLVNDMGATLYMISLAVCNILLHKYTGQEDIVIGSVTSGRGHIELHHIIGIFVNMHAMRNFPGGGKTFREFLEEVKKNALDAFENQEYPFECLVSNLGIKREPDRHPLVDVVFQLQNLPEMRTQKVDKLKTSPFEFKSHLTKFDLYFELTEIEDTIEIMIEYSTELFNRSTVEILGENYTRILGQVLENSDIRLEEIKILRGLSAASPDVMKDEQGDFDFQ